MSEIYVALWIMFIFAGIAGAYQLFSAAKLNSSNVNPEHSNPKKAKMQRLWAWICLLIVLVTIVAFYYKL